MDRRHSSNDSSGSSSQFRGWNTGQRKKPSENLPPAYSAVNSSTSSSRISAPVTHSSNTNASGGSPTTNLSHAGGHQTTSSQPAAQNPWGRTSNAGLSASLSGPSTAVRVFPQAFQVAQGSGAENLDSSDEESVSGGEEDGHGNERTRAGVEDLEGNIFGRYLQGGNLEKDGQVFSAGLEKIRDQLLAGHSGASRCLICLERIKSVDSTWHCFKSCHCIFHLACIQSWARQSANAAAARAANENLPSLSSAGNPTSRSAAQLAALAALNASWHCPKCRNDYSAKEVPKEYRCFCGKERDPEFNPWLAPHSCGETCEKKLSGNCGHKCTLLCHPGPCPPCPQLIKSNCYCEKKTDFKRCGHHEFSCSKQCGRQLACGKHPCEAICHAGECPPCPKKSEFKCRCGRISEVRSCAERDFSCEQECGTQYSCAKHYCEEVCHKGPCGNCPLTGKRSCPCGKVQYNDLPCDRPSPTCGSTCEKPLACGHHLCPERCHTGACADTCRVMIAKRCRCGGLKKEVPCSQDLHCERRCQRQRNCERHMCKRRCCDGACPPCAEVCGKKLRCGNHKCGAPCHSGPCAPCPVAVRIACACNSTAFSVPCGAEKEQRPPKCSKKCSVKQLCNHGSSCKAHRCHYGACPPCDLACNQQLPCGHRCPLLCHGPKPPPNPEYTLRPRKKRQKRQADDSALEGQPCPPCLEPVVRLCRGRHSGQERVKPCSEDPIFSCHLKCGNPLACGNHKCELPCHVVTVPRNPSENPLPLPADKQLSGHDSIATFQNGMAQAGKDTSVTNGVCSEHGDLDVANGIGEVDGREGMTGSGRDDGCSTAEELDRRFEFRDFCEPCTLLCQRPRVPMCPHPCLAPCHLAPCEPCKALVKRKCHCGAMKHVLACHVLGEASPEEQQKLTSCGGPCHKKLPFCTHLCPVICHPGNCPNPSKCKKKVTVRCACQRLKKEWPCAEVQIVENKRSKQKNVKDAVTTKTILGVGLLPCDEECLRLERERREREETASAAEQLRQRNVAAAKEEVADGASRPRRRKQKASSSAQDTQSWMQMVPWDWLRWGFLFVLVVVLLYGSFVGLSHLSQWMNAREASRTRRRPRTYHH